VFLQGLRALLNVEIAASIRMHLNVKLFVVAHVSYEKVSQLELPPILGYLRTQFLTIIGQHGVPQIIETILTSLRTRHVNFMRESSGLRLRAVTAVDIYSTKFNPFGRAGGSYVELPTFLRNKHAIINVQNSDNRCFAYSLLSALHPATMSVSRAKTYERHFASYPALQTLQYPVELDHLESVERAINISFNVYSFFDDEGRGRYPVYLSKISQEHAVDLLFWNGHYAWIKYFSGFLADGSAHHGAHFYCKRCLGRFQLHTALQRHLQHCLSVDDCKQVFTMPPEGTKLRFINVRYQQRFPFIVYADFEALTVPCDQLTASAKKQQHIPMHSYQSHKPISVGMKLVSSEGGVLDDVPYDTYTGDDVVEWFLRRLLQYREWCFNYLFDEKRLVMTPDTVRDFETATM
jgi:hypothetical protein